MVSHQKINRDYYNKNSERWARKHADSFWHETQFRKFIKHFKKGDKIIDIGCAHGIHVPLFLGIGRRLQYEGLDISAEMLKVARRRYPQLKFFKADISDQKTLPKKKYAGFWAGAVLMHIPENGLAFLLSNIEQMVKSGGIGYLTLPRRRPSPESEKDPRHFSFWTPHKAKTFFRKRRWRILNYGNMPENNGGWFYMIVLAPKR